MKRSTSDSLVIFLSVSCGLIIALLPFHAFFTTWAGSSLGHIDLWRIWKELLIVWLVVPSVILISRSPALRAWLRQSWLVRAVVLYTLLYVVHGLIAWCRHEVSDVALVYGWLSNLRFLGFFMIVVVASASSDWLSRNWSRLVLWPAVVVVVFGLLQRLALPVTFLSHFGYGPDTIPAYHTVDNKLAYQRIQSTLRGPNPLGAYLVVVASAVAVRLRRTTRWLWLFLGGVAVALLMSYSRSAYIGVLLALGTIAWLSWRSPRLRQWLATVAIMVLVVGGSLFMIFRNSSVIQNTLFHTDNASTAQDSSNEDRTQALQTAWREVMHEPLGRGPGTAGPASFRNTDATPRIAENYFLQIGQEVGWLGIALFVAINVMVVMALWPLRRQPLALALLGSWVGLTFINLVSHAWADDTLGLLWWGLAGIALGPAILKHKHGDAKKTKA